MKSYQIMMSRYFQSKQDSNQILMLSVLFSTGLLACRILYTKDFLFAFLMWNLFLAWIPYALSSWMSKHLVTKGKLFFSLSMFIWLLFIPNSFYIITDLFHLEGHYDIPQWFDLVLILSFAWNGLLFGMLSVRSVEKIFQNYFKRKFDLLFIFPVMALNGLGVYIGRYLRFNSWDIITNPSQLTKEIIFLFIHPVRNRFDWSMIVCYTIFMTLIYFTIKKLSKAL